MPRFAPAVLAALAAAPLAPAAGPYDGLLAAVPPQANCLVLVDVRAAFASPLAQSEKWAADVTSRYKSGVGFVPPDAVRLAIASQVNLSAMTRYYQVGLVTVGQLPSMRSLAEREGGFLSQLAGQTVCLSPRDVYFATVNSDTQAAVYPADRQATARWLGHATASKGPALSPYLKAAADAAGGHTVTVAVDLADAVDPGLLRLSLANSPVVVRSKGLDLDGLARQVASVRGLTFTAGVTDKVAGAVRVDFAADPSPYKGVLRDLFLELLADQGAIIPGVEAWEARYEGNAMTLAGPLDGADLRRVLSLFDFPGTPPEAGDAPAKVSVTATRQYLGAVDAILADVRKLKDGQKYDKTATWQEQAAEQIDQLTKRGVDPAAVEAAQGAADRLRAIAGSLRGVPIDVEKLNKKVYAYGYSPPRWQTGWWGANPGFLQTNLPEIQQQVAKVVEDDKQRRADLWAQIDQGLSAARNALREKYKEKF
ncbi:MAG: hypothetical protein K2X87_04780 [Gemmataceae bacterium]|nr:hypothetical protein [Gemmataceae bacterium]